MSLKLIQERLETYHCTSQQEEEVALKEIFQEIALASLGRTDFFKHAAFQGGTALRILYSLERFSEDLDFTLKTPDSTFSLRPFLDAIAIEAKAYDIQVKIEDRTKAEFAVKKAFLKDESLGKILTLQYPSRHPTPKKLSVKLEVDTNPPEGGAFELKYLDFPFASGVAIQNLPSLFAGKCHALLCREYVKGRDWYDFVWYVSRKTPVNFLYLENACHQQGPWKEKKIKLTPPWFLQALKKKIQMINWKEASEDVKPFIKAHELPSVDLWSTEFFLSRIEKMKGYL